MISVLDHPNIIQYYGAVHTPNFCIVTGQSTTVLAKCTLFCLRVATNNLFQLSEYADKGSLFDRLYKQNEHINMDQSLLWSKQIAEGKIFPMSVNTSKAFVALPTGMKYLHENDLVHRDLKSSNGECCEHYTQQVIFCEKLVRIKFLQF